MTEPEVAALLEVPITGGLRERLEALRARHAELELALADPGSQKDRAHFQEILKEHGSASGIVALFREYATVEADLAAAAEMVQSDDPEEAELGRSELEELEARRARTARLIREQFLDSDVEGGDSNAIVEIRAGAGGDEAALFAGTVYRMYTLFAEAQRWKIEVLSTSETNLGGYKDVTFMVKGKGAYGRLRFESGGHRVQRVPETESQGRIHTSAVTVAVMPEVEESEITIDENDLRIDTFCASGPGGQKVNKTASAVRMTHVPTGIVVSIQDEKSQHKNRAKAMTVMRSRLREKELSERREKEDQMRRSLIGSGDRSDRVRTYNFPQNRVTDHRLNVSLYSLEKFMQGEISELLDQLATRDREDRVQAL